MKERTIVVTIVELEVEMIINNNILKINLILCRIRNIEIFNRTSTTLKGAVCGLMSDVLCLVLDMSLKVA